MGIDGVGTRLALSWPELSNIKRQDITTDVALLREQALQIRKIDDDLQKLVANIQALKTQIQKLNTQINSNLTPDEAQRARKLITSYEARIATLEQDAQFLQAFRYKHVEEANRLANKIYQLTSDVNWGLQIPQ